MRQVEDGLWTCDFSDGEVDFKLTIHRRDVHGERRYAWRVVRLTDGKSETGTESSFYAACATAGVRGAGLASTFVLVGAEAVDPAHDKPFQRNGITLGR